MKVILLLLFLKGFLKVLERYGGDYIFYGILNWKISKYELEILRNR